MPSLTLNIPHKSETARKILGELRQRVKATESRAGSKFEKWRQAEDVVGAYVHESEVDRVRKAEREGGAPQYTTIQIPYTYAVLMAAHTYFTSVFMARNPIFQYQGRHGESQQQIQAIEALIDYQAVVGGLMPPLYTWMHDAGKYGAGIIGNWWEDRVETISTILMEPEMDIFGQPTGKMNKMHNLARGKSYSGNRIYNVQPWDFIWDVRYPIRDFQKGEYCGVKRKLAWNELKRREKQGYYYNLDNVPKSSGSDSRGNNGSANLDRPDLYEAGGWGDHSDGFGLTNPKTPEIIELVVDIIPKEWGLSENDWPEKWVFTCTADFSCLIGVQPHGALHSKYPYQVLTMEAEAYGLVPRGIPETLEPIQQTIDWLVNSHFYNIRAALNNKMVVDPSRVVMKDVLSPLPGGVIRLKPTAYGQDIKLAIQQLNVQDVTQNHLKDLQMMYGMGERTMGVNDQIMGMLNTGGGRKTATEVRTSTSFGVNRLKTVTEYFSVTGFDPLSQMLLQNTQQYYDGQQKFKIAGDLAFGAGEGFINVDPGLIQGAYNFVPVDGTLPIDRYAQANLWKELLMGLKQMPEIALQYDTARIFEWVAQLAGLKNITQFKLQVQPDPNLLAMAKLGNVVPFGKPGSGGGRAPGTKPPAGGGEVSEPRQIAGMGQTG